MAATCSHISRGRCATGYSAGHASTQSLSRILLGSINQVQSLSVLNLVYGSISLFILVKCHIKTFKSILKIHNKRSFISPGSPATERNNACSHLDSQRFRTWSPSLSFLFFLDQLQYNTDNILSECLQTNSRHYLL